MNDQDAADNSPASQDATPEEDTRPILPKLLIAPIAIVIAAVMIGLPLLRVLTVDDDSSLRNEVATDARGQVAVIFGSAVLESRSRSIANRYAVEDIHGQLADVIAGLRRRDPQELQGAVARTVRSTCAASAPDQECFTARLARSGEDPIAEISFVVGIVDGAARVVAFGDSTTVLLRGGGRSG